ncbi:MAG: hypothetical protein HOG79_01210 [Prolixibacteraceae bacterium]|nr:hypothetical protein [Prolixibacteraceae bacterium]
MGESTTIKKERKLRRELRSCGLLLKKSRRKNNINADTRGGYMIMEASLNVIVRGSIFELSLEDVEDYLHN